MTPLAVELARLIKGHRGKRVPVAELYSTASRFDPGLVGDAGGLARFRDALTELESAEQITLPAPRSTTGWDRRVVPAIPLWVTRIEQQTVLRPTPVPRVWPHLLEAAGAIATRADERQILDRIAAWMREDPAPELVPVQERSLELFDDEKALDGYLTTRLFTSGALTLELLVCFPPPLPFVSQHVPGVGVTGLLVLENRATYTSFLSALRALDPAARPDLHLAWGHGNGFSQSVLSIPLLEPAPRFVRYFGDLDLAGLLTASNAAAQAAAAALPQVSPATSCYRFLLDGPPHWRTHDASNQRAAADHVAVCSWLPPDLRSPAAELFSQRLRVPQERLGHKALRRWPGFWTEFEMG